MLYYILNILVKFCYIICNFYQCICFTLNLGGNYFDKTKSFSKNSFAVFVICVDCDKCCNGTCFSTFIHNFHKRHATRCCTCVSAALRRQ